MPQGAGLQMTLDGRTVVIRHSLYPTIQRDDHWLRICLEYSFAVKRMITIDLVIWRPVRHFQNCELRLHQQLIHGQEAAYIWLVVTHPVSVVKRTSLLGVPFLWFNLNCDFFFKLSNRLGQNHRMWLLAQVVHQWLQLLNDCSYCVATDIAYSPGPGWALVYFGVRNQRKAK